MFFSRLPFWLTIIFPLTLVFSSALSDVCLSLIAMFFLFHCTKEKNWEWLKAPWVRFLLLLWFYMLIRSLFAESPLEALKRSLPFVRYFVFAAALGYWILRDKKTVSLFLKVLTATFVFIIADSLLQWCIGQDILGHPVYVDPASHFIRLTGAFSEKIVGIMLAWLAFPVCFNLLSDKKKWLAAAILIIATIIVILLSGERMALLLVLTGFGFSLFLLPIRKSLIVATFMTGIILLALIAFTNPLILERQVNSTITTFTNWKNSPYGLLFTSDFRIAALNPVFGMGANHFRIICPRLYATTPEIIPQVCNIHPHNIYMELLIDGGIVELLLFIAFAIRLIRFAIQSWDRYNFLLIGTIIAFSLRLWPLASTTSLYSRWGAPPFWLIVGMLLAYGIAEKEPKVNEID